MNIELIFIAVCVLALVLLGTTLYFAFHGKNNNAEFHAFADNLFRAQAELAGRLSRL